MGVGNLGIRRCLKATLLLLLFVFALSAQAAHQMDTPAKPLKECGAVDVHFHLDSSNHNCDLCDYKVTADEFNAYDYCLLQSPVDFTCLYFKRTNGDPLFSLTNKGPPNK